MQRLLYISASSPVPSKLGPARRNFHVIEQLAREFDVTVLTTGTQEQAALFASLLGDRVPHAIFAPPDAPRVGTVPRKLWRTATGRCDFLPAHSPSLRAACTALFAQERFDAVVLSHVLLRSLPIPDGVPVIGDTHNAEFDVLRRLGRSRDGSFARRLHAMGQWRATRREEQRCARNVALLCATSPRDADLFSMELGIHHTVVVANGIDLREFVRAPMPSLPDTILFSGLMSYYPNQQGIRWFVHEVLPLVQRTRPGTRLVIAGAAPPPWMEAMAGDGVEVTGAVPDMRPYLTQASVVLAPLWHGGGTRVKILEAMATGRPVVSTTIGCEGLGAAHDEALLVADTPAAFAAAIVRLLDEPATAQRIADGGYAHVATHYDWEAVGAQLRRHVRTLLGEERAARRRVTVGTA